MLDLKTRKKQRAHMRAVYSGEVKDLTVMLGQDASGNPVNADGSIVNPDTAIPGDVNAANTTDYTKMTTHAELDAAVGARTTPDGWDKFKVDDKQKWLADNAATATGW